MFYICICLCLNRCCILPSQMVCNCQSHKIKTFHVFIKWIDQNPAVLYHYQKMQWKLCDLWTWLKCETRKFLTCENHTHFYFVFHRSWNVMRKVIKIKKIFCTTIQQYEFKTIWKGFYRLRQQFLMGLPFNDRNRSVFQNIRGSIQVKMIAGKSLNTIIKWMSFHFIFLLYFFLLLLVFVFCAEKVEGAGRSCCYWILKCTACTNIDEPVGYESIPINNVQCNY